MTGAYGLAPRDRPKLTTAELAPIFAAYPNIAAPLAVAWHSLRPFAASALVDTELGKIFVKRHDSRVRGPADLHEEHAFIAHLRAAGAAVPQILAAQAGATAISGALGIYELHAPAPGEDRYRDDPSWTPVRGIRHAAALGRALARLHRAAAGFARPARAATYLVAGDALLRAPDLVAALGQRAATCPSLGAALSARPWQDDARRTLLPWHLAAQPHAAAQKPLWAHADLHASNALWRGADIASVIDFGLCNQASAMFDLATTLERNTVAWLRLAPGHADIGHPDLADALIRAYATEFPLTHIQASALPHLLPVVHLDFALSELAYFHAITRSPANAEAAYTDFLLSHTAWFATEHGRTYLAGINASATA